jgi:hypothetical protein
MNTGLEKLMAAIDAAVEAASPEAALASFRHAWRTGRRLPVDEAERDALAEAAVSNNVLIVGNLLASRDVNRVFCTNLPRAVARRPKSCVLLDVAVGAGAVEASKFLIELHGARPTGDTLKMAISAGSVELIRLVWVRLLDEPHARASLLEVAAEFHREVPLMWLFRDSTVFEQELLFVFALEARTADGLLGVHCEGFRPWWHGTRGVAAKYREAGEIEWGEPPEGFSADDGWSSAKTGSCHICKFSTLSGCHEHANRAC